jgi:hypothetical protein
VAKLKDGKSILKSIIESLFNVAGASFIDKFFMMVTQKRWRKLYSLNYKEDDFQIAFKSRTYTSKNHPRNFQKKVMESYHQQMEAFRNKFDFMTHE